MHDSDEELHRVGRELAGLVLEQHTDWRSRRILDVGSGYGRLAIGLIDADFPGRYEGFDILAKQVAWCRSHLTPVSSRYRFHHLDVHNDRYNPRGRIPAESARFPVAGTFDGCAVFSVFTHMERVQIAHYLREIAGHLSPDGVAVATFFLWDETRLEAITSDAAAYPMRNERDRWTRFHSVQDPLLAIAHHTAYVEGMATASGLSVREVRYGSWAGDGSGTFQDVVVLGRSSGRARPRSSGPSTVWRAIRQHARRVRARARRRTGGAHDRADRP
jgi:SAM-dependent methyltransferase